MRELQEYITVGTKRLRCGYTTGTCAAAAARAAAELLLRGEFVAAVTVSTPAGIDVVVEVEEHEAGQGWAQCAVRKDSGDDPDVTNGVLVYARVEFYDEPGVRIEGGKGVGRVTREGLDQPVGAAAINSVPRRMIMEQIEGALSAVRSGLGEGGLMLRQSSIAKRVSQSAELRVRPPSPSPELPNSKLNLQGAVRADGEGSMPVLRQSSEAKLRFASCGTARGHAPLPVGATGPKTEFAGGEGSSCDMGVLVTVSIPAGVELAAKTFNPRLGIEGGISVIGTSGVVRPMSEDALVSSIELEMRTLAARGVRDLLVVPGNYGRDFACGQLALDLDEAVSCSNYFGATLDAAAVLGFESVLIVGHIGKMAKVAGGIMNTHSRVADCRVEVLAAHAALVGAPQPVIRQVMGAATTDAALEALTDCGLADAMMESLTESLADKLNHRAGGAFQVEAVVFSNVYGVLGQTQGASELVAMHSKGEDIR